MPMKSASKTITRQPDWLGPAVAPGEILLEEYLKPLGLGQVEAARRLGISLNRLNEIVRKRAITAELRADRSRLQASSEAARPQAGSGSRDARVVRATQSPDSQSTCTAVNLCVWLSG